MLRSMMLASVLLISAPAFGPAFAEELPVSPVGLEVRGDDGTALGRVEQVTRDGQGRIVSVELSGLEAPADSPYPVVRDAAPEMVALEPTAQRRILAENAGRARLGESQLAAR